FPQCICYDPRRAGCDKPVALFSAQRVDALLRAAAANTMTSPRRGDVIVWTTLSRKRYPLLLSPGVGTRNTDGCDIIDELVQPVAVNSFRPLALLRIQPDPHLCSRRYRIVQKGLPESLI